MWSSRVVVRNCWHWKLLCPCLSLSSEDVPSVWQLDLSTAWRMFRIYDGIPWQNLEAMPIIYRNNNNNNAIKQFLDWTWLSPRQEWGGRQAEWVQVCRHLLTETCPCQHPAKQWFSQNNGCDAFFLLGECNSAEQEPSWVEPGKNRQGRVRVKERKVNLILPFKW